ncbi:MAG: MBL fold metallo-hydrolase [Bacillus sp. (in: firmicutes)]
MSLVGQINSTLYCIDCHDLQRKNRTGCYVIKGEKITLIETSASPSIPYILQGLKELDISCDDVAQIIVTHIHLDHAGGAGLLLEHCRNANIIVHPKGARHLEDPSRLIAGARAVYGEDFDNLFDPIVPIPKDRLITMEHKEQLVLNDRILTFYHSPGHANHHFSIHDSLTNGIFTGDTAGVYYRELDDENFSLILPSTSPSQFLPEAMLQSLDMFEQLNPDYIYFGHYGSHNHPADVFAQVRYWLPQFVQSGKESMHTCTSMDEQIHRTYVSIKQKVTEYLSDKGLSAQHPIFEILDLDIQICSQGIVDYLTKAQK